MTDRDALLIDAVVEFVDSCVLIVDDQAANVDILTRLLLRSGLANVHGLTDSREAVARCLELRPDLLLLDLHMPHFDGHDVLAALRAAMPSDMFLPVLVLTADMSVEARERALSAGAKDFLTKPFDSVEAVQRVRNLLETQALYQRVRRHNATLRAELDRQAEEQRRVEAERARRTARVETVLRSSSLRIVFQPIVDLRDGVIVGFEALARFDDEPHRPPHAWFAEAAEVGLGLELELAAIDAALAMVDVLPANLLLSVNVSPDTATSPRLVESLARVAGPRMVLELTEHSRIDDYQTLVSALDALRHQGIRIAVDDAGAGYAGLQQILGLRPDVIKLDVDLTGGIDADPVRRALAASLVKFSADTGAVIVAEGIETPEELRTLRELGVAWGQGYFLARPAPLPLPKGLALSGAYFSPDKPPSPGSEGRR